MQILFFLKVEIELYVLWYVGRDSLSFTDLTELKIIFSLKHCLAYLKLQDSFIKANAAKLCIHCLMFHAFKDSQASS